MEIAPTAWELLDLGRRRGSMYLSRWQGWRSSPQKPSTQPPQRPPVLHEDDGRYRTIFEHMLDGAFQATPDGRILTANPALVRMLGFESENDLRTVSIPEDLYLAAADREPILHLLDTTGVVRNAELHLRRKDGSRVTVLENSRAVRDEEGRTLYYEGVLTDITERREAQDLFQTLANATPIGLVIVQDGLVQFANPAFLAITGLPASEVEGREPLRTVPPEERTTVQHAFESILDGAQSQPLEYRMTTSVGDTRWIMGSVRSIEYRGRPAVLGIAIDITQRKEFEARLAKQAFYDALTGLANRTLFMDRLEHALESAERRRALLAIMFVDLDGFKQVNDERGHRVGDELLTAVAGRLQRLIRRGDTVARFGGDEFTILLETLDHQDDAMAVGQRVVAEIGRPFEIDGDTISIGASIGLAFATGSRTEPGELLRRADVALYHAKRDGKGRYVLFDPEQAETAVTGADGEGGRSTAAA